MGDVLFLSLAEYVLPIEIGIFSLFLLGLVRSSCGCLEFLQYCVESGVMMVVWWQAMEART